MNQENCNQVIDYFNGHLSENEQKLFKKHLMTCADCREDLEELQSMVGDVAFLAKEELPSSTLKTKVLTKVFEDEPKVEKVVNAPKRSKYKWLMPLLAASLVASLAGNLYTVVQHTKDHQQERSMEEQLPSVVASLNLQPSADLRATATASMIRENGNMNIIIQAKGLNPVQKSEVYQVWLIKDDKPYPAGAFVTDQKGNGTIVYAMSKEEQQKNWDTMAITKEPDVKNKLPKGPIVLSANF
ncbi:anti-sigma factor [Peribacillus frigoritolerans]|uniref:Anti-sigma-W factor RsiW n=1 Tax=Peribacillus castrilensis TaxID=2897690 RepID=A0AAW9NH02_9BACI|nr:anti-sigma factor [Peribacillus castrilensis]